jgi:hypothetical protein
VSLIAILLTVAATLLLVGILGALWRGVAQGYAWFRAAHYPHRRRTSYPRGFNLTRCRRWVCYSLWAASAYAALAYFVPVLRVGPLDDGSAIRWQYHGCGVYTAARADGSYHVWYFDLWGSGGEAVRNESIRFWGVDTSGVAALPDIADRTAHDWLGATLLVHTREHDARTGRSRLVAEVRLTEDGRDVGAELVRRGVARWDRREAPVADHLRRAEAEARAARRGQWARERQRQESGMSSGSTRE